MTLIAFSTGRDSADVLTDTGTYTPTGSRLNRSSKIYVVPHLDMAVAEQGGTEFALHWRYRLSGLHRDGIHDFDSVHAAAPGELRALWVSLQTARETENAERGATAEVPASCLFHIGYSAKRRRFVAYGYSSDADFEPVDLSDGHVMPAPIGTRLGDIEKVHLQRSLDGIAAGDDEIRAVATDYLARLTGQPAFVPPSNRRGWVELATRIRTTRALAPIASGIKTPVAGDVFLTNLRRGEFTQRKVHTFRDSDDELLALVAGTLHPLSQHAACAWCDSGRPYVDCCLTERNGQPCPCQSGRDFDDCCSVRSSSSIGSRQPVGAPRLA